MAHALRYLEQQSGNQWPGDALGRWDLQFKRFCACRTNVDAQIGPLQDNGGPTLSHALLTGSPAMDAGVSGGLLYDQRGQSRTVDNPAVTNSMWSDGSDIGAMEVNHVLTMTEARKSDSNILVRFTSVSDKTYGLQYKDESSGAIWTTLPGLMSGSGGMVTAINAGASSIPRRFYGAFEH